MKIKTIYTLFLLCPALFAQAQLYVPEIKVENIADGNVGIGINAPNTKLHLYDESWQLRLENPGTGGSNWYIGASEDGWSSGGNKLIFSTNGTSTNAALAIDGSTGNIGVGKYDPSSDFKIDVDDGNGINGHTEIRFNGRAVFGYDGVRGAAHVTAKEGKHLIFDTDGSNERMRIDKDGHIGIGKNDPQYKLHVSESSGNVIAEFNKSGSGAQSPIIRLASNNTAGLTLGHQNLFKEAYVNHSYGSSTKLHFMVRSSTKMTVLSNGNVGIGDTNPGYKLEVNGTVRANTFSAVSPPWADFVFEEGYQLPKLEEVEQYIQMHKHLPDIPSEKEVMENGIDLGAMNAKLLQKVEELTLYLIEQNKTIQQLEEKVKQMETQK